MDYIFFLLVKDERGVCVLASTYSGNSDHFWSSLYGVRLPIKQDVEFDFSYGVKESRFIEYLADTLLCLFGVSKRFSAEATFSAKEHEQLAFSSTPFIGRRTSHGIVHGLFTHGVHRYKPIFLFQHNMVHSYCYVEVANAISHMAPRFVEVPNSAVDMDS